MTRSYTLSRAGEHFWSSTDVCRRTGITYRELDYWTRANAIWPTVDTEGYGTPRCWSDRDLAVLITIAAVRRDLAELGLPVSTGFIANAWDELHQHDDVTFRAGMVTIGMTVAEVETA
jgi:hypothetical protein